VSLTLKAVPISWEMNEPFTISRGTLTHIEGVLVELRDECGRSGRGESYGILYEGETPAGLLAQLDQHRVWIEQGPSREALLEFLPHGGARCAVDLALWDLEAQQKGVSVAELAGVSMTRTLTSAFTIGMRSIDALRATAARYVDHALLKIKVDAESAMSTLEIVREVAPKPRLIVDSNQSWTIDHLKEYAPRCEELGVVLLEQPLAVGRDDGLLEYRSPVPVCADELIHTRADLPLARGKYEFINIKLDKSGGLTEGLYLANEARTLGYGLMIGCMAGSSLSMVPAMVIGQMSAFVDLDGPLLQREDWPGGIRYDRGVMSLPQPALWGEPRPA